MPSLRFIYTFLNNSFSFCHHLPAQIVDHCRRYVSLSFAVFVFITPLLLFISFIWLIYTSCATGCVHAFANNQTLFHSTLDPKKR